MTDEVDPERDPSTEIRTAFLGRFGEFEGELVLDILKEAGIFAYAKHPTTEGEHSPYPGMMEDRGVILVDAARLDDARALVDEQLPVHLKSIQDAMAALEDGTDVDVRFDDAAVDDDPDGSAT